MTNNRRWSRLGSGLCPAWRRILAPAALIGIYLSFSAPAPAQPGQSSGHVQARLSIRPESITPPGGPIPVPVPNRVTAIAAGADHTCALVLKMPEIIFNPVQYVECWGANLQGQLGDGTTVDRHLPTQVHGLGGFVTQISLGDAFSCALLSTKTVECWGDDSLDELGDNSMISRTFPATVPGLLNPSAITSGSEHACALESFGEAQCWGYNDFSQLGNAAAPVTSGPVAASLSGASTITSGNASFHTCALFPGGSVRCWGFNNRGQLGGGTILAQSTPMEVRGVSGAVAVATGLYYTCALMSDSRVMCWGDDTYGQLGDGAPGGPKPPGHVSGLSGVVAIAEGGNHSCALMSNGTVMCWGANNFAQLGDGTTQNSSLPVQVQDLSGAVAITAGGNHTCALLSSGDVMCWGGNYFGQLGDGTTVSHLTPVLVQGPF